MAHRQFTIRSLLFVIILVAMLLGLVTLSRENARLRRELADSKAAVAPSLVGVLTPIVLDTGPDDGVTTGDQLRLFRPESGAIAMPNGARAFADASDGAIREVEK
jgi:hypothetical protein